MRAIKRVRCNSTARMQSPTASSGGAVSSVDFHALSRRSIAGNRKSPLPNDGSSSLSLCSGRSLYTGQVENELDNLAARVDRTTFVDPTLVGQFLDRRCNSAELRKDSPAEQEFHGGGWDPR